MGKPLFGGEPFPEPRTATIRPARPEEGKPRVVKPVFGHGARMGYTYRARIVAKSFAIRKHWWAFWTTPEAKLLYCVNIDRHFINWSYHSSSQWFTTRHEAEAWGHERLSKIEAPPSGDVLNEQDD